MKYFGSLTSEQKTQRIDKLRMFYNFISFDWGDERPGPDADWKTGEKQWQIYKEVHGWADHSDEKRQQ